MIALLLIAMGVLRLCTDLAIGRGLRVWLVERPAAWLDRLTPARLALILLLMVGAAGLILVAKGGADGLIFAPGLIGEGVNWLIICDGATYLEVLAAVWIIGAALRLKPALALLRSGLRRGLTDLIAFRTPVGQRGRRRARRVRRSGPRTRGQTDDAPAGLGWA